MFPVYGGKFLSRKVVMTWWQKLRWLRRGWNGGAEVTEKTVKRLHKTRSTASDTCQILLQDTILKWTNKIPILVSRNGWYDKAAISMWGTVGLEVGRVSPYHHGDLTVNRHTIRGSGESVVGVRTRRISITDCYFYWYLLHLILY
jgi:hypothetical protein